MNYLIQKMWNLSASFAILLRELVCMRIVQGINNLSQIQLLYNSIIKGSCWTCKMAGMKDEMSCWFELRLE